MLSPLQPDRDDFRIWSIFIYSERCPHVTFQDDIINKYLAELPAARGASVLIPNLLQVGSLQR